MITKRMMPEKMYRKQQMEPLVMSRKWEQAGKNL